MAETAETKETTPEPLSEGDLKQLKEIVASLQYGSVNLIIQNGKLVQIEKNEKIRLV
jgi:hypothetical protein